MSSVISDPTFTVTPTRVSIGLASGIDWYPAETFAQFAQAVTDLMGHHTRARCVIELDYGDTDAPLIRLYFNTSKVEISSTTIVIPTKPSVLYFNQANGLRPSSSPN